MRRDAAIMQRDASLFTFAVKMSLMICVVWLLVRAVRRDEAGDGARLGEIRGGDLAR